MPPPSDRTPRLTAKQRRFIDEYLVDLNGRQAAIRAGYSEKTATVIAGENLRKPCIAAALTEAFRQRAERTGITADTVLRELLHLARADITLAFSNDGSMKPLHQIPEDVRRAISAVEIDELFEGRGENRQQIGFTRRLKFWDKVRSLELLGKHLQLWTEKLEITGRDGGPVVLTEEQRAHRISYLLAIAAKRWQEDSQSKDEEAAE